MKSVVDVKQGNYGNFDCGIIVVCWYFSYIFLNHSKTHWLSIEEHTDSRHLIIIKRHCYTIKFSDEAGGSEIVKINAFKFVSGNIIIYFKCPSQPQT